MTPRQLIALCLAVTHASTTTILFPKKFQRDTMAPDFWWDLTLDHNASVNSVLTHPPSLEKRLDYSWDLGWAKGDTRMWSAGGSATWTVWTWDSETDCEIRGGGFLFNVTGTETLLAGVSWLRDGHSDIITWNCFVEGNWTGPIPWSNWKLYNMDGKGRTTGFVKEETSWGFYADSDLVMSKHCANGIPVTGKRFEFLHGKDVGKAVQDDPFITAATSTRHKRSPQFFEKVGQKVREWFQKAKEFLGIGQQDGQDGQQGRDGGGRSPFMELLVRLINLIFGRRPPTGPPGSPPNGAPPGDDFGGDPPGGADIPPADAEELDPSQNDAVRDWE